MDKNINVLLYGYGEGMRDRGGINEMLYWFLMLIKLRGKEKKSGVSLKLLIFVGWGECLLFFLFFNMLNMYEKVLNVIFKLLVFW